MILDVFTGLAGGRGEYGCEGVCLVFDCVGHVCTGAAATLADVVLWKAHSAVPLCWLSSFLESFLASEQASSKLAGSTMPQGLQNRHTQGFHFIASKIKPS